ncbi:hypothetical protein B4134_2294 [Bacillus safensis]|nr:hypothetical protein B4134_2294 [Bacillus safensis]
MISLLSPLNEACKNWMNRQKKLCDFFDIYDDALFQVVVKW